MQVKQFVFKVPLQLAQVESQHVLLIKVRPFKQDVQFVAELEQVEHGLEQVKHVLSLLR